MDCPFCLHKNVFMINTTDGGYQWYCFHASCKAKGKDKGVKNMKYVEKILESNKNLYNYWCYAGRYNHGAKIDNFDLYYILV